MKKKEIDSIEKIEFNKDKEISINYVFSHSKFPEIIFKDYKEFIKVATQGQNALCIFLDEVWKKVKNDLIKETSLKLKDSELRVDEYSFQIAMINIKNNYKILNLVMPTISDYGECKFISILLEKQPKYFTCELAKSFNETKTGDYYCLGEWEYNSKKDKFTHKDYGRIEDFSINKYLMEINNYIKS